MTCTKSFRNNGSTYSRSPYTTGSMTSCGSTRNVVHSYHGQVLNARGARFENLNRWTSFNSYLTPYHGKKTCQTSNCNSSRRFCRC